jgi:hypothetical protein
MVKDGRHGLDGRKEFLERREQLGAQDARLRGGGIRVVGNRVPSTEDQIFEAGEGHEVLDQRVAPLFAAAEADVGHLGQRPGRGCALRADGQHPGHERGGDGTEAGREHAEAAGGRPDRRGVLLSCRTLHGSILLSGLGAKP